MEVFPASHVTAAAMCENDDKRTFSFFQCEARIGLGTLVAEREPVKTVAKQFPHPVSDWIQELQIVGLRVQADRLVDCNAHLFRSTKLATPNSVTKSETRLPSLSCRRTEIASSAKLLPLNSDSSTPTTQDACFNNRRST